MTPSYWQQATQELSKNDAVMHKLISRYADTILTSRGDAFTTLVRSIVGQQISVKAAESVWQKIITTLPDITPASITSVDDDTLRACGLSFRKISYIKDCAYYFASDLLKKATWNELDDEALITVLTNIKGIGRWTAEMFLIFHMQRSNILPLDDIGLQRAISIHYNEKQAIIKQDIKKIAQPWHPWCSVATWYLWRSLDPIPVEY